MKKSLPEWIWYAIGVILLVLLFTITIKSPVTQVEQRTTTATTSLAASFLNQSSDLMFIEFVDYQCPYCAQSRQTMQQVRQRFDGQNIDFQTHHYPLATVHPQSVDAAIAFECAKVIDKQKEMADWMFVNQNSLYKDSLTTKLQSIGVANPDDCFNSQELKEIVIEDISLGNALGVQGTPTFVIIDPKNTSEVQIYEGSRQVTELSNEILARLRQ